MGCSAALTAKKVISPSQRLDTSSRAAPSQALLARLGSFDQPYAGSVQHLRDGTVLQAVFTAKTRQDNADILLRAMDRGREVVAVDELGFAIQRGETLGLWANPVRGNPPCRVA